MRSVLALMRASWMTMISYRLATVFSAIGLVASFIPIYFIAKAVAPMAASSIGSEGGDYFGFVVIGLAATAMIGAATSAIPGALAGSIGNGTFEALLVTRTSVPALLTGLVGTPLVESAGRALLLLIGAALLGVDLAWGMLLPVSLIAALTLLGYAGAGLVAGALVLAFRTSGPITTAVIAGSSLLGGVYFSTSVIPGWLQGVAALVPLTYALRATRRLLLGGADLVSVVADVGVLALLSLLAFGLGCWCFAWALRRARSAGTLSQY